MKSWNDVHMTILLAAILLLAVFRLTWSGWTCADDCLDAKISDSRPRCEWICSHGMRVSP